MDNKIIFDWFSFTSKIHSPRDLISMLGLHDVSWQHLKGAQGYQDRLYYDKISIHYNGRDDMGVWCEMSGQGCRAFETYGHGDYKFLFDEIMENREQMNITRLDIAFDDHDGLLDIDVLCKDTNLQNYISKFNSWEVVIGSSGSSILHGSRKSDIIIRIYDKAAERQLTDGSHWVRIEIQLRRDRAFGFLKSGYELDIGRNFCGILNNYLRYVVPGSDSNRCRWATADYWQNILTTVDRITLYSKPGVDYNIFHLENFVMKQAGNAIDTYLEIMGKEKFFASLQVRGTTKNPKYEMLKSQYKRGD